MAENVSLRGNPSTNRSFPTSHHPDRSLEEPTTDFYIAKLFFYFLILSASFFGNGVVAYIICAHRRLRTPSNFLVLNLAVCDLVTPLISIVFDFVLEEHKYVWFYGGFMCKILWPAQTYFSCASSLTLAVISLDRYRLIMHPFKTRLSMKKICALIFFVHALSLLSVSPYAYVLRLESGVCEEHWSKFAFRQAYTVSLFLIQYGLPLCFMVLVYGVAVRALHNTSAKINKMRENSISSRSAPLKRSAGKKLANSPPKVSRASSVMRSLKKMSSRMDVWNTPNAKATKMFIIVVVVFAIFMFPNQVVWLWADFGGGSNNPNFTQISIICWLFTYTNCVVNPIIFGIFSRDFRKGFKRIVECFFKGLESSPRLYGDKKPLQTYPRTVTGSRF